MEDKVIATGPHDQRFLYGHVSAQAQLIAALKADCVHHAWLFSGMAGIGKATLAYFFVRYLLSIQKSQSCQLFSDHLAPSELPDHLTDIPTNTELFHLVACQSHPDFRLIQRSVDEKTGRMRSDISITQIRELSSFLHMTPSLSSWRVVMVDGAEEMNRAAANALLKILEEPPKNAVVVLTSHTPARLLPTLRSRCRHLRLSTLDDQAMLSAWQDFSSGDCQISQQAFDLGQQVFSGSIGQVLSFCELQGSEFIHLFDQYFASLMRPSRSELIKLSENISGKEDNKFQLFISLLVFWIAHQIKSRACQPEPDLLQLRKWTDFWDQSHHKLKRLQQAHLDKKMVLLEIFCAIDELVRT